MGLFEIELREVPDGQGTARVTVIPALGERWQFDAVFHKLNQPAFEHIDDMYTDTKIRAVERETRITLMLASFSMGLVTAGLMAVWIK